MMAESDSSGDPLCFDELGSSHSSQYPTLHTDSENGEQYVLETCSNSSEEVAEPEALEDGNADPITPCGNTDPIPLCETKETLLEDLDKLRTDVVRKSGIPIERHASPDEWSESEEEDDRVDVPSAAEIKAKSVAKQRQAMFTSFVITKGASPRASSFCDGCNERDGTVFCQDCSPGEWCLMCTECDSATHHKYPCHRRRQAIPDDAK